MTAILLGMIGLDPFHTNPQPEPSDGESAEVERGVGGSEGDAVIATEVGWQATPRSLKSLSNRVKAKASLMEARASQGKRKRLA